MQQRHLYQRSNSSNRGISRSGRCHDREGDEEQKSDSTAASVVTPAAGVGSQVSGAVEGNVSASKPHMRQYLPRRHGAASHGWVTAFQYPTLSSAAGRIFESGPKSRGFPYASMARETTLSDPNLLYSAANPAHSVDPEIDI